MSHQSQTISSDIQSYLQQHERKELLRFITCGSVDDGKSTLIGRLLHDSKMIYEDQFKAIAADSQKFGTTGDEVDLALLVDGLQSEREQGITIDVAYRYFSTEARKFIIADTPGHEQYTRNMATGASTADLAVILVDARKGVQTQTKRHSYIVSLLGIKHAVVTVNKMDLVGFDKDVFDEIEADYRAFANELEFTDLRFVPVSALQGDNVVELSADTPWFKGESLLGTLEHVPLKRDAFQEFRYPVQYVNRPHLDFRGYCGTVAAGRVAVGDKVMAYPSRKTSQVASIVTYDGDLGEASEGQAVTLTLADELDIGRGDMLVHPDSAPSLGTSFDAAVVWMAAAPLLPGKQYLVKLGAKTVRGSVERVHYRTDVNTLEQCEAEQLKLNEIGSCRFALTEEVAFDPYDVSKSTGNFILIDRVSNGTVGAGIIHRGSATTMPDKSTNVFWHEHRISKEARANQKSQKPCVLWFTGLSGSGKSTISNALEARLFQLGHHSYLLDGDNVRHGLNKDLGFTDADREENIRRIGETAKLFVDAGLIVLTAFISPFRSDRQMVRGLVAEDEFVEIFVDTPLEVCEARDPKGSYAKARRGDIKNFTGIDSPYEPPRQPEITLHTERDSVEECVEKIVTYLRSRDMLVG